MAVYISIFFGIIVFCIIVIVFNNYGVAHDKVNERIIKIASAKREINIDEEMEKPLKERFFKPMIEKLTLFFSKYYPTEANEKKSEQFRKMLRKAGITISPGEYNTIRLIVILGISILFFIIGLFLKLSFLALLLAPLFGAYIAYTFLRFHLTSSVTKRRELIERQMPDVFDMISVNVEAGLGFEQAILHVINHFEGPLIDELTVTYREMSMGRSRKNALQLLGERCEIEEMKSFASAIIQAGKMGISIKNVLNTQAKSIRQSRRNKIEEKAMKISVKILIPMAIFIFPVIFIALLGPAVVNIMVMFGGM